MATETAIFGAGCFWGVEAAFRRLEGVIDTEVGYAGGDLPDPDYRTVCAGHTGHAEVVRVRFDPERLPYERLLELFFEIHDPTQLNRQGPDVGSQYRSIILASGPAQMAAAQAAKAALEASGRFASPIVTEIVEAGPFYRAEDYHQRYLEKRGLDHG